MVAEQQAARECCRAGQAVGQQPTRNGIIADLPQQQAVVPGEVPGGVDGPAGNQVIDGAQMMIDGKLGRGFKRLPDRLLSGVHQLVHFLVVGEMRTGIGGGGQGGAGADQRQRQVVVDVCVHAGQRELDRFDPGIGALLHQRPPGQRHRRRIACGIGSAEVQAGEHHVQLGHEGGIGEKALAQTAVDLLGYPEVHAVETR